MNQKEKKQIKIGVHSGVFHSDDVFVVALFKMLAKFLNVDINIERITDVDVDNWDTECGDPFKGIVADIGGGRYDHHQFTFEFDDDGDIEEDTLKNVPCHYHPYAPIPKAAIGLIWSDFGTNLCSLWLHDKGLSYKPEDIKDMANDIEDSLIMGISAVDNGVLKSNRNAYFRNSVPFIQNVTSVINDFRPTWQQEDKNAMDEGFKKAVIFAEGFLDRTLKQAASQFYEN